LLLSETDARQDACSTRSAEFGQALGHNITITTRLVDAAKTPMLLKTVKSGKIQPKQLITHHFVLNDVMQAYYTFGNAMQERALKVIITND
jgi:alcohol dehydrogenase